MTKELHYITICLLTSVLFGCVNTQTTEQSAEQDSVVVVVEETPIVVEPTEMASYPPEDVEPIKPEPQSRPSNTSSSYSNYNGEESSDYWEEKRKHSPNDNYLLGFDEDVDDVHDMELYMEDY